MLPSKANTCSKKSYFYLYLSFNRAHEDAIVSTVQKVGGNPDQKHPNSFTPFKESQAQDIFDFGYVLLQCALGDFSMSDPTGILTLENLKGLLDSRALKKHSQNACCLLHSEELVRKLLSSANNSYNNTTVKKKIITNSFLLRSPRATDIKNPSQSAPSLYIPLLEVLTTGNRFSEEFEDFLCCCLKLEESKRIKARDLLNHSFLSEDHNCKGPNISLKEFLKIVVKENESSKHVVTNFTQNHLEKFTEALSVVFLNKNVQDKFERMIKKDPFQKVDDKKIQDLANELEVEPNKLWEHVKTIMSDVKSYHTK